MKAFSARTRCSSPASSRAHSSAGMMRGTMSNGISRSVPEFSPYTAKVMPKRWNSASASARFCARRSCDLRLEPAASSRDNACAGAPPASSISSYGLARTLPPLYPISNLPDRSSEIRARALGFGQSTTYDPVASPLRNEADRLPRAGATFGTARTISVRPGADAGCGDATGTYCSLGATLIARLGARPGYLPAPRTAAARSPYRRPPRHACRRDSASPAPGAGRGRRDTGGSPADR